MVRYDHSFVFFVALRYDGHACAGEGTENSRVKQILQFSLVSLMGDGRYLNAFSLHTLHPS